MSSVRQFEGFDLNDGPLGPGETNFKGEPPFLVSVFLAWQVTLYLLASLHAQKVCFYTLVCSVHTQQKVCKWSSPASSLVLDLS